MLNTRAAVVAASIGLARVTMVSEHFVDHFSSNPKMALCKIEVRKII
jgi:hypothetical protein